MSYSNQHTMEALSDRATVFSGVFVTASTFLAGFVVSNLEAYTSQRSTEHMAMACVWIFFGSLFTALLLVSLVQVASLFCPDKSTIAPGWIRFFFGALTFLSGTLLAVGVHLWLHGVICQFYFKPSTLIVQPDPPVVPPDPSIPNSVQQPFSVEDFQFTVAYRHDIVENITDRSAPQILTDIRTNSTYFTHVFMTPATPSGNTTMFYDTNRCQKHSYGLMFGVYVGFLVMLAAALHAELQEQQHRLTANADNSTREHLFQRLHEPFSQIAKFHLTQTIEQDSNFRLHIARALRGYLPAPPGGFPMIPGPLEAGSQKQKWTSQALIPDPEKPDSWIHPRILVARHIAGNLSPSVAQNMLCLLINKNTLAGGDDSDFEHCLCSLLSFDPEGMISRYWPSASQGKNLRKCFCAATAFAYIIAIAGIILISMGFLIFTHNDQDDDVFQFRAATVPILFIVAIALLIFLVYGSCCCGLWTNDAFWILGSRYWSNCHAWKGTVGIICAVALFVSICFAFGIMVATNKI